MKMGKKFFVNTLTAVVMGLAVTSCGDEDLFTERDALKNANKVLDVEIAANQDWKMSAEASTAITINMDYDETYDITVFANDPLTSEYGTVLTQGTVGNGEMLVRSFEYPKAITTFFVAVRDSHGHTFYRTAPVVDGKLSMTVGTPQVASARGMFRSSTAPEVPDITIPDDAYAKSFLTDAKEPTDQNTVNNYNNSYYSRKDGTYAEPYTTWYAEFESLYPTANYGWDWSKAVAAAQAAGWEHFDDLFNYTQDETYVKKFKITGTYNKGINVLSTEQQYGDARTVYISGKWTVAGPYNGTEQRVGGGAVIVVDAGGELNIPEGITMTFVNQARLVVMPGGKITGGGKIEVTNGNAEGLEGYNGGTIDIGTFNNNFGKFYNYGTFKCTTLQGGAGLSNFYNHGVAHIVSSGTAESGGGNYSTPNTRIFNACQFYCEQDMRAYVIEMTGGSYFKVGGELMMSDGTDGTATNSYVALAAGALMEVGTLRNNNCSWTGPTSGYAVLQAGGLTYLNWTGNEPITQGYFINNIAVSVDDTTIGAGMGQGTDTYVAMRDFILNGYGTSGNYFDPIGKTPSPDGNGGAVMVNKGCANMSVAADEGFTLGAAGCTPGYNPGTPPRQKVRSQIWSYAFEDSWRADYDMNDVVLKLCYHQVDDYTIDSTQVDVTLCCTGASYDLTVYLGEHQILGQLEVHAALCGSSGKFINTGDISNAKFQEKDPVTIPLAKPAGFNIASADIWVKSPERDVHVSTTGQDPHGVIIPGDWRWPKEWTCIKDAYPDFVEFAKDPSNPANAGWYNNPVTDLLY